MNRVIREEVATVIEVVSPHDSLDDEAMLRFAGLVMEEASQCEPPHLVIDLTHMSYIGSSFVELLVRAWKRLKERGGSLVLCGMQPFCAEVLRITRLDNLWEVYPSRAEAIAACAKQ